MAKSDQISWRSEAVSRVVLGAAQLGFRYGVANQQGKPTHDQAVAIVREALGKGIHFFDTAQGYGESEKALGDAFRELAPQRAHVISKITLGAEPSERIIGEVIGQSVARVGRPLWGLLLHKFSDWRENRAFVAGLVKTQKSLGQMKYFGVSVYSPEEALEALGDPAVDVVQVPANVVDGRMRRAGVLSRARDLGKLCFVRSIYLQGLLTMSREDAALALPAFEGEIRRIHEMATALGEPLKSLAARYAVSLECPLVVGFDSVAQVRETTDLLMTADPLTASQMAEVERLQVAMPESLVNPSRWPTAR